MALIRQANARTMAREAIVLDLGDLAAQGELLKARARAEADQVLEHARAERERLLRGAAEEGRRTGLAQGLEEGRRSGEAAGRAAAIEEVKGELRTLEGAWSAALAAFETERDRMLLESRQDIVELAAAAAELVTKRAIRLEPERVADQLGAVLALVSKATRITVAIHPEDEALVRDAMPALSAKLPGAAHVEFLTDGSLDRGSCVARSGGGGVIDASIRTQLERIVEALLPEPGDPHPPEHAP